MATTKKTAAAKKAAAPKKAEPGPDPDTEDTVTIDQQQLDGPHDVDWSDAGYIDSAEGLTRDRDREFFPSPAGAVFVYLFADGTRLKVWQYPGPRGRRASVTEDAATTVNSWRVRLLTNDTPMKAPAGLKNPDRVFTTTEVNDLVAKLAADTTT